MSYAGVNGTTGTLAIALFALIMSITHMTTTRISCLKMKMKNGEQGSFIEFENRDTFNGSIKSPWELIHSTGAKLS